MKKKKAVSKARQILTVSKVRRLPPEDEILEMAELASYVFDLPESAGLRTSLKHDSFVHFGMLKMEEKPIITYFLQLILRCPQILRRPPGFEWILDELQPIMLARKMDPEVDTEFWQAIQHVRAAIRPGRPRDRTRDFFRYKFITDLMAPPQQLKGIVKLNKTKAVERCSEAEQRLFGGSPDVRAIWRSVRRVEQFLQQLGQRIQTESSFVQTDQPERDTSR
jgi:hypothetical protein